MSEIAIYEKEPHPFQKVAALLADYGFNCIKLDDDWQGADFLAFHKDGATTLRVQLKWVRLFFVGGRISLCGSEAGGNWIRHGVVREQRRGPVADGTCAVSDGWGCSAGTRALGGGSQYASMRRRPVAA